MMNYNWEYLGRTVCTIFIGGGVSEFELQLVFYVHIWTNTLGKGMNPLIPQQWVE